MKIAINRNALKHHFPTHPQVGQAGAQCSLASAPGRLLPAEETCLLHSGSKRSLLQKPGLSPSPNLCRKGPYQEEADAHPAAPFSRPGRPPPQSTPHSMFLVPALGRSPCGSQEGSEEQRQKVPRFFSGCAARPGMGAPTCLRWTPH